MLVQAQSLLLATILLSPLQCRTVFSNSVSHEEMDLLPLPRSNHDDSYVSEMRHKNMKSQKADFSLGFYINGCEVVLDDGSPAMVDVSADMDNDILDFDASKILSLSSKHLTDKGVDLLGYFLRSNTYISIGEPLQDEQLMFKMEYDESNQSLCLNVYPLLLSIKRQDLSDVGSYVRSDGAITVEPSRLSGYINTHVGYRNTRPLYRGETTDGTVYTSTRNDFFGNLECVANYKDFLLNGYVYFLDDGYKHSINRGNILLSKDLLDRNMHVSVGDLNIFGISFQNSVPLLGVSLHKSDRIFVDATVGPISRHELFLNVPSKVEVWLNDVLIKILYLSAGPHSLENFPLIDGASSVELKIFSPTGEERIVNLNYFYNSNILPVGCYEYYVAFGFPTFSKEGGEAFVRDGGFNRYSGSPVLSAFITGGLSPRSAASAYIQIDGNQRFFGGECIWSDEWIHGILDLGGSYVGSDFGCATRVSVGPSIVNKQYYNWHISFDYSSENFTFFGGKLSDRKKKWSGAFGINFPAGKYTYLGWINEYISHRNGSGSYYSQWNISQYLFKSASIKGYVSYSKGFYRDEPYKWDAAFSFDFSPRIKNFAFNSGYNSKNDSISVESSYFTRLPCNESLSLNIGYSSIPRQREESKGNGYFALPRESSATGGLSYDGRYINLNMSSYLAYLSSYSSGSTIAVTNVNFGSAIVFADGIFAISKPLRDSFVMVAPNSYIKKHSLVVNPTADGGCLHKAFYWLPAVIPIPSYKREVLNISTDDHTCISQEFEGQSFRVDSMCRNGSLIYLGEQPTSILELILVDKHDKPIANVGGMLILLDGKGEKVARYPFVSDRYGIIQVSGLVSGTYLLDIVGDEYLQSMLVMPEPVEDSPVIEMGKHLVESVDEDQKKREKIKEMLKMRE